MPAWKIGDIIEINARRKADRSRHVVESINNSRIDQGHVTADCRNLDTDELVCWTGVNWETMRPRMSYTSAGGFYDDKKDFPEKQNRRIRGVG